MRDAPWPPAPLLWRETVVPSEDAAAEHRAGRAVAEIALRDLGVGGAVTASANGSRRPVFPDGVLGSIAHDGGLVAVGLARRVGDLVGLGVDVHRPRPLSALDACYIASPDERRAAGRHVGAPAAPHLLFALKEAVFKAFSSVDDRWLELEQIQVLVQGRGRARLLAPTDHPVALSWRWHAGAYESAALVSAGARTATGLGW